MGNSRSLSFWVKEENIVKTDAIKELCYYPRMFRCWGSMECWCEGGLDGGPLLGVDGRPTAPPSVPRRRRSDKGDDKV